MLERTLAAPLALAVLSLPAAAQAPVARQISAPVKNRGTYHVASGTWSRARPAAAAGSKVLYNNTAPSSPAPLIVGMLPEWRLVDHGRVPSPSSPATSTSVTGTASAYDVSAFEIGYCSAIAPSAGGLTIAMSFHDGYAPCSDIDAPAAPPALSTLIATGLPAGGAGASFACWTMTFDLSNTTLAFALAGDADGSFDGDPDLDSFGFEIQFPTVTSDYATDATGPLFAGQCPPGGPGTPTSPQQGFGTRFGGVPGATDATGLGSSDLVWLADPSFAPGQNGACFNFGPCGGFGANPYAGFWLQVFGDDQGSELGTRYCSSVANATGSPAVLVAEGSDPSVDLVLTSSPVPNTTGQFFYGPMMLGGTAFGDGLLCVGGMTTRMLPLVNAGMMMQPPNTATFAVDYAAPYASGLIGTRHFQHWFRSGLPGAGFNTSDALAIGF